MEWLNEPANWQRTGDLVTVSVDTGTDFWRETGYGYVRDSGHVYGEVLAGDLDVSVRVRCTLSVQYDQAGVMLRADERTWLKTGMEFFEGRPRLSTVLTLGRSSWMVTDLPAGTDEIVLRVSRRGDAVEVRYVLGDSQPELAALAFLPPGREVLAGVMGAAPEGPGFRVTFQDLRITEPDWSAPADGAMTWQDDQPSWAESEAPGWSQPEGEPGWSQPEGEPGWSQPEGEPGWASPAAEDAGQAPRPDRAAAEVPSPDGPAAPDAAAPNPVRPDAGLTDVAEPGRVGPGPGAPGSAGRVPGAGPASDEPGRLDPPGPEARNRGTSPADWAPGADRDAAADWDLLAAGAQADPAERWIAQSDADVADEWPGPPVRTAVRNGPPASDAMPAPAVDPADEVQTDPGLATGRSVEDAATLPDQAEASTEQDPPAAGEGTAEDSTTGDGTAEDGAAKDSAAEPGPAKPKPSGRESRRARSKRAAADPPAEPDAADEWISLLTADPAEE